MSYAKIRGGKVSQYPISATDLMTATPTRDYPGGIVTAEDFRIYGCQPAEFSPRPSGEVVTELVPEFIDGVLTQQWEARDMNEGELEAAKADRHKMLNLRMSEESRPLIDTGFGFEVHGGYSDLADFQVGEGMGILTIRAADNSMNTVTSAQFSDVVLMIKQRGLIIKQNKWALADAIRDAENKTELDAIDINEGWG